MWGFAEVLGIFFTVLRVYGPVLRHSYMYVSQWLSGPNVGK